MNVIPKYVYVSPLIFLFIFFSWIIGRFEELVILYLVIIIHELSHVAAAKYYNLKVDKISITPIGINAKINFDRRKKYNEIIICLAGPISNLVMIIIGVLINSYFWDKSKIVSFFIMANVAIFSLNILPVLPLDGGRIFKDILLSKLGYKKSVSILSFVSRITSLIFIVLGVYQLLNCWYNLSLLFIGIFIYLWLYKEKEEIEYSLIRELIHKNQNLIKNKVYNIRYLACFEDFVIINLIKNFVKNKYHIIKIFSKNNSMIGELTETQLFNSIVKLGYNATLKEALEYYKQPL